MSARRVLVVFGTRPEAIKMAPVVAALRARPGEFETTVAVTAQHREMLDQVLALFGIVPDIDLGIMQHGQSLTDVTERILRGMDGVIARVRPHVCLVQGDTTTTFAAALAAFYHRAPVGHVEAGLRSFDRYQPYPEEANRRLASVLAEYHFAPTALARDRLLAEGVDASRVWVTGNTVIDALLDIAGRPYEFAPGPIAEALASGDRIVLMTMHRRENWGEPVGQVCRAITEILDRFSDVRVIVATHANPVVREVVDRALADVGRVTLLGPVDYLPFVHLLKAAQLVLTDSGGIQEEAPSLGVPVLVLRDVTERPEAAEAGTVRLVGTRTEDIVREATLLLGDPAAREAMARAADPFGDGTAARQIADILASEITP
ncbi:MAG: non-hydrolyzing UDP-N-acetylglucosamine 2-epimerase [Coriobacteriia bacterium]